MKRQRILTGLAGILAAALLGATSFAIAEDPPPEPPPLPPPGSLVPALGPDGESIICPDGQVLKVEVGGPAPDIPGPDVNEELDDSVPDTPEPPVAEAVQPLVPGCGPDSQLVWEPLSDEASTVHSLGFDGTCDISARVNHAWVGTFVLESWEFDFNATGSCTGRLDDEQIQDAPVSFSVSTIYSCAETDPNQPVANLTNLSSTLNFSGTYEPGIDAAIRVSIDFARADKPAAITGKYSGAAELTGNINPWTAGGPCWGSTATFTGQLQTLQPLQG